jgi:hypothetical protein
MHINAGDTAWMLTSTALVFFMMPGLALFYGGLVGAKNVIATMVQSFVAIGVISLLWVILGYSLAFGADHWGVIGSLQNVMLRGVNGSPNSYAPTIPSLVYMAFQMKFAVITPALIAGRSASGCASAATWSSSACGRCSSTVRSRTASGAAGFSAQAACTRSTSPGARSSTSWPARRRSPPLSI